MIRQMACAAVLAGATVLAGLPARAQDQGARAGNSYLPSTHTKGCSGFLCDADDPRRAPGAPPPPACEGLLCSLSPYAMGRPVTAAEAARLQQAPAPVQAAPATEEPAKPKRSARRKKAKTAKTVAARTPDPTPAATGAAR